MKNIESWKPSKYNIINGKLKASRDKNEVSVSSRLIVDMIAGFYDQVIPKYSKGRLIDLGCGKSPLYLIYQNHSDQCTCVEWPDTIHKNNHIDYYCDLNQELPLGDSEYNTVILSDVLEHIYEPKSLLNEIYRIMAGDSYLLMNTPFYYWLHEVPYDYYRYTEYGIRHLLEKSGFKVIEITPHGGAISCLADVAAKMLNDRLLGLGTPAAKATQYIASKCLNIKQAPDIFPLIYTAVAFKE